MTHADAFLRDILAHPDDDAPRLIFADWLEEQGDASSVARAEFIRIQCALATEQPSEQRRNEMVRREQQILDDCAEEWARPIRRLIKTWAFHRGFIDDVTMLPNKFLAYAGRVFSRAPIQHLALRPYVPSISMAAMADNEHLRCLRSLDLSFQVLGSRDVQALAVSENLPRLTSLNLSHNRIGDGGIRALARSPLLGQLERLNLRFNDIGANGLHALSQALEELADSSNGLRLRRLELNHPNLSAAGQRVITDSPLLRRLVRWR